MIKKRTQKRSRRVYTYMIQLYISIVSRSVYIHFSSFLFWANHNLSIHIWHTHCLAKLDVFASSPEREKIKQKLGESVTNAGDRAIEWCRLGLREFGDEEVILGVSGMGGLSPTMMATTAAGCGGGANGGGASGNCCDMSVRCWCRWHCKDHQHGGHHRLLSSGFLFFMGCFVLLGSIGMLYAWLAFTPTFRTTLGGSGPSTSLLGCQEDNEGSWSVGVFYGDSPFSLKPIEAVRFIHSLLLFPFFHYKIRTKKGWFFLILLDVNKVFLLLLILGIFVI